MAENEILDLGNPRLYARFRHLLAAPDASAEQVVDGLIEDFTPSVRRVLRRAPLHTVLKACGGDRLALQEVVAGFKERAMAALVQQAHAAIRSNDPAMMAAKVTELLCDGLIDRGKSKRLRMQEQTQRCRAFLFFACAAVAANAYGVERIEVFENGVGAINLPLMTGMLGSGLCTRGAHPTSLRLMSELTSRVMERAIRFELPFAAKTKAELISDMTEPSLGDWALESRSCVHTSSRQAGRTHCGRCPACIERRQAFAAAGIAEDAGAYQVDIFTQPLVDRKYADYFDLYREDAISWLANAPRVRRRLNDHLRITDVPAYEDDAIVELQMRNAREVVGVFHRRSDGGNAIGSATYRQGNTP